MIDLNIATAEICAPALCRSGRRGSGAGGLNWCAYMLKLPIIGLGSCLLFGTAASTAGPLEIRTGTLATRYLQVWSSDGATAIRSVPDLYERRVTFYGQQYTHHQLMAEKRRAIRRWPVRRYAHRPGTLR